MSIDVRLGQTHTAPDYRPLGLGAAGLLLAGAALLACWPGAPATAVLAGLCAAIGITLWSKALVGGFPPLRLVLLDGIAVALIANAVEPQEHLWGLPWAWSGLLALTPQGGIAAAGLYL